MTKPREFWIQEAKFFKKDDPESHGESIYTLCLSEEEAKSCIDKFHVDYFKLVPHSAYQSALDERDALLREVARLRELVSEGAALIEQDNVFGVGLELTNFLVWKHKVDSALARKDG